MAVAEVERDGQQQQQKSGNFVLVCGHKPQGVCSPFNPAGLSYQVYKHAIDDGLTDGTKAIQDCIADQDRCGGDDLKCAYIEVQIPRTTKNTWVLRQAPSCRTS
ncbi:hypothetical protein F5Y10DRAFT_203584 [Nemania abortiva]|nr:hypothetical protein F5Y10DRAFT_203584 [Nemania abortiva]